MSEARLEEQFLDARVCDFGIDVAGYSLSLVAYEGLYRHLLQHYLVVQVFINVKIVSIILMNPISILGVLAIVDFLFASIGRKSSQTLLVIFGGGLLPIQEGVSPHHRLQLPVALLYEEGVEAAELDELARVDIYVRAEHVQYEQGAASSGVLDIPCIVRYEPANYCKYGFKHG